MKKILIIIFLAVIILSLNFKQQNKIVTIGAIADSMKIDTTTGLIVDKGIEFVTAHCTGCHSSKLIINFHSDRKGWLEKIRWMQKTQKLWQLGEAEPIILNYLAKNYPPQLKNARREPLKNINWYKL